MSRKWKDGQMGSTVLCHQEFGKRVVCAQITPFLPICLSTKVFYLSFVFIQPCCHAATSLSPAYLFFFLSTIQKGVLNSLLGKIVIVSTRKVASLDTNSQTFLGVHCVYNKFVALWFTRHNYTIILLQKYLVSHLVNMLTLSLKDPDQIRHLQ